MIRVTSHQSLATKKTIEISFSYPKCFTPKKFILPSKPHAFSTLTNNCLGSICKTPFAPNSLISGGAEGWGRGMEVRVI